jgi:hypothetical protein
MSIIFTFNVSDLSTTVTPSNQWAWNASCKPELPAGTYDEALGRTTKHWTANLSIGPISESVRLHRIERPDEWHDEWLKELLAAEADGTGDATNVSVWPPGTPSSQKLVAHIGLRPQRYELFRAFVTLHFGRSDLICRIVGWMEFATAGRPIKWPTYDEFLEGRTYLNLADSDISFRSRLPASLIDPLGEKIDA